MRYSNNVAGLFYQKASKYTRAKNKVMPKPIVKLTA